MTTIAHIIEAAKRGLIFVPGAMAPAVRVTQPELGVVVHEHDASPSVRARIRNFFGREP